jgi:hypothetical protein
LKFQKTINSIIILDSLQNDTIFVSEPNTKHHLIGNYFELSKAYRVGRSSVNTSHSFLDERDGKPISRELNFEFETENLMDIDDWEKSVFS